MTIEDLIAECTAYDYKVMLEENRPKSWLKSVSAFANTMGGSLFFGIDNNGTVKGLEDISSLRRNPVLADVMAQLDYMEKRGSGLKRICNETKALESYKDDRRPVFKSSPSQFMTIIYSVDYTVTGNDTGNVAGNVAGNGQLNGQLNDSQKETFEFIKAHEGYNTTKIMVNGSWLMVSY